jgi:hypothetical protein
MAPSKQGGTTAAAPVVAHDEDDLIQVRRGTRSRPRRDARGRMDGWRRATDRTTARAMGRAGRSTAR